MKGLKTLIKLSKRQLDELRRDLATLERQKEQLLEASKKLSEELQQELELASQQTEMRGFFGGFAKRIQTRQEELAKEVRVLDKKMQKLADDITVAFAELKRYEIALEAAVKRQKEDQARKDTIALDEIAGNQHRRKQTEHN